MKILIIASSSFAAQGLPRHLQDAGHEVWTFDRSASANGDAVRRLHGPYDQMARITGDAMGGCDCIINLAIAKFASAEENLRLCGHVLAAYERLQPARFVQISSISVLPSVTGSVNEKTPRTAAAGKGEYARVKIVAEEFFAERIPAERLVFVRPGFILGAGIIDSMVGIGKKLPTGRMLGMGSAASVIPLLRREDLHEALARIVKQPMPGSPAILMLVAGNAPTRQEYLDFHCRELGRGSSPLHLPSWFWTVALFGGSLLLWPLRRKWSNMAKLFQHNLKRRTYDCSATCAALGMDFSFDWKAELRRIHHSVAPAATSYLPPDSAGLTLRDARVAEVTYIGLGRIVQQKHLPALNRLGFRGKILGVDPVLPADAVLGPPPVLRCDKAPEGGTHAVITAPHFARERIFAALPASLTHLLLEKPLAISGGQFETFSRQLAGREVAVIHNYRWKKNVAAFRRYIAARPPGALRHVSLHFDTPTPAQEPIGWVRRERANRVLVADYALHFIDLAWMFFGEPMRIDHLATSLNDRGETESVRASLGFGEATCDLFLRQGAHQRSCRLQYVFQNYTACLSFFPDVFLPVLGGAGPADDLRYGARGIGATFGKVLEKLGLKHEDLSHDEVLRAFMQDDKPVLCDLSLKNLEPFYRNLFTLLDRVYDAPAA